MIKKIMSLMIIGILSTSLVSAGVDSDIRENDDGTYLVIFSSLTQTLAQYILSLIEVRSVERSANWVNIFFERNVDIDSIELIQQMIYYINFKTELLKAGSLYIEGQKFPIYCDVVDEGVDGVYGRLTAGTKVGWYRDYNSGSLYPIFGDIKCGE